LAVLLKNNTTPHWKPLNLLNFKKMSELSVIEVEYKDGLSVATLDDN